MRIGQGIDAHRLVAGRRLIIGGVDIPHDKGLEAHSDGDVLLHAISDALLGAAGQGDIGRHFPDNDPAFKDADSRRLLQAVVDGLARQGWQTVNVDATIIAQAPRMQPHLPAMVGCIAQDLGLGDAAVNLKATTMEWMGFTGRGEGIAATAVVLIEKP
ncbi:2-C-methyl-D-erythritol 2,4-cyclodiphosphate synthase [Spiribacter pallidus]|uniref:2-C-methyl-D-erythritol 2,4-cyclodiphosphate synthase n=1 Tax=Spiribacter pallidus TaxID=1987936 RepID=A0ABV3TDK2_9GAMM